MTRDVRPNITFVKTRARTKTVKTHESMGANGTLHLGFTTSMPNHGVPENSTTEGNEGEESTTTSPLYTDITSMHKKNMTVFKSCLTNNPAKIHAHSHNDHGRHGGPYLNGNMTILKSCLKETPKEVGRQTDKAVAVVKFQIERPPNPNGTSTNKVKFLLDKHPKRNAGSSSSDDSESGHCDSGPSISTLILPKLVEPTNDTSLSLPMPMSMENDRRPLQQQGKRRCNGMPNSSTESKQRRGQTSRRHGEGSLREGLSQHALSFQVQDNRPTSKSKPESYDKYVDSFLVDVKD